MKLRRKAQAEMIGLVVIVILITLGMLFLAQFALKGEPTKKVFTRKGLAYSTMSALMKTTINSESCQRHGISSLQMQKDILEDCAVRPKEFYPASSYACSGLHSCDFFLEMSTKWLNETLGSWGKHYELNIDLIQDEDKIRLISVVGDRGGCPKRRGNRDTSGLFPLPTKAGMVEANLFICD